MVRKNSKAKCQRTKSKMSKTHNKNRFWAKDTQPTGKSDAIKESSCKNVIPRCSSCRRLSFTFSFFYFACFCVDDVIIVEGMLVSLCCHISHFLVAFCIRGTFVKEATRGPKNPTDKKRDREREKNVSSSVRFERLLLVYEFVHCLNYM